MALQNITTYCSQTDVQNFLSVNGVTLRLDDGDGGDPHTQRMTDSIIDASETINYYCWPKYTPDQLSVSNWVNRACMKLATWVLCSCRGNEPPESLTEQAEKIQEMLEEIRDGAGKIPGIALRIGLPPTWDNTRLVPRYDFAVIRVERKQSSQQPMSLPTNIDYRDQLTYEDFLI